MSRADIDELREALARAEAAHRAYLAADAKGSDLACAAASDADEALGMAVRPHLAALLDAAARGLR